MHNDPSVREPFPSDLVCRAAPSTGTRLLTGCPRHKPADVTHSSSIR